MSLAGQKVEQPSVVVPFFSPFGLKIGTLCLEIEILRNISKKKDKCHPGTIRGKRKSIRKRKSALFREFQVMYSAESKLKQRWSADSF